jgi:hypothetical protein
MDFSRSQFCRKLTLEVQKESAQSIEIYDTFLSDFAEENLFSAIFSLYSSLVWEISNGIL